jgi:hypothetical protein
MSHQCTAQMFLYLLYNLTFSEILNDVLISFSGQIYIDPHTAMMEIMLIKFFHFYSRL